jgi:ribosomal protein L12E/L44/L45/RPP1/RPP2
VTITKAAGVTVDAYWPGLFAKLFAKKGMEELISSVGARE